MVFKLASKWNILSKAPLSFNLAFLETSFSEHLGNLGSRHLCARNIQMIEITVHASTRNTPAISELRWRLMQERIRRFGAWRTGEGRGFCAWPGKGASGSNYDRGLAKERRRQIQEVLRRLNQWGWLTKWIRVVKKSKTSKIALRTPAWATPKQWYSSLGMDVRGRSWV